MSVALPHTLTDDVHAAVAAMAPCRVDTLTAETRLTGDLGYDSVRLIELSMVLERRFNLPPLEEAGTVGVSTVGDVVSLVARLYPRR